MGVVKKRDPSFDLLKALAIYMVVLSHAIASAAVRSEHVCIVNFIVGVNMPLFFMISGYFAVGMITRGDKLKLVNRLIDYWWPVAVFSVVSAVWACGVQNTISVSGIPLKAVKQFLFSAWFFYALSICDGVTFFAYRFGKWNCVIGSFLLLLVVPPFWYKGDALNMLPFFLFGAFLLPKVLNMPKGVFVIVSTLCMAIYLGAVLFCGDFWENGLAFYTNYLDIYHFKPDLLSQFLTRCVLGLCGSLALIGVLRGLLASFPFIGGLAPIGEQTMGVYFIHRYGLAIFAGCGFFTDSLTGLFASAVLVFLFCSIIVAVSKRNRICRIALWGLKIKS